MRPQFLVLLILFASRSFGQDVSIPDYRGDKDSFQKIQDKTLRKELALITIEGNDEASAKTRLIKVPVHKFSSNSATFKKDTISVTISAGTFDRRKHKLHYVENNLVRIDNKAFWGTDGGLPKHTIQSVRVTIGNDVIEIPISAWTDLFEPNLCWTASKNTECHTKLYVSPDKRRLYIYMLNSDGAGGYEVTWIVQDKKYLRRVVDYGF